MLNLLQRLILGCAVLAALTVGLALFARHALAGAGEILTSPMSSPQLL